MVLTLGVGCYHHILALGFFLRPSFEDVVHTVHASKLIKEQCHLLAGSFRGDSQNNPNLTPQYDDIENDNW